MEETGRRSVRCAVLGSPIRHSISPVLHSAAYAALGLTWWRYTAIECDEAGLPGFLDRCGPDWAGLSLTMPLKRAVLPLLDRVEPLAVRVGGANTVLLTPGSRLGYNTDVPGMVRALAEHGIGPAVGRGTDPAAAAKPDIAAAVSAGRIEGPPVPANGMGAVAAPEGAGVTLAGAEPVLILGAGATASAALAALADLGQTTIAVAARDPARTRDLRAAAERIGVRVELRPFTPAAATATPMVVSTVPAGAAAPFASAFTNPATTTPSALFDVIYDPWPTPLAAAATKAKATVVNGFDLLLHQAAAQVELFTGRPAPLDAMRQAGRAELTRRGHESGA